MTRTSLFLEPYKPDPSATPPTDPAHGCGFHGHSFYTDDELLELLEQAVSRGLHATGDGTVRQVLDAAAKIRARHGTATAR